METDQPDVPSSIDSDNGSSQSVILEQPENEKKRKRTPRPYPTISFEEALELAQAIQQYAAGKKVRRVTLLDQLKKSENSSTTRQWITDASKYGLIEGSYRSEHLELTPDGYKASSDVVTQSEKAQARVTLAILNILPFELLYNEYSGDKLPLKSVLADTLRRHKIDNQLINQLVDTFLVNVKFLGLLKPLAGADRIITLEHLLEDLPQSPQDSLPSQAVPSAKDGATNISTGQRQSSDNLDSICFYVTPIGESGTETRQHSDLFLEYLVKPALEQSGLKVVRGDHIDKPGVITRQIIEYLLKARLVVVDLSFHNPNVFYELALRHATRLPTVQIIRTNDIIPFDLNQTRTIRIDCSSIYTLVPKLDTYRAEIANQVRRALEDPDSTDNPITTFYPAFKISRD